MLNSAIRIGYLNKTAGTMLRRFVTAFIVVRAILPHHRNIAYFMAYYFRFLWLFRSVNILQSQHIGRKETVIEFESYLCFFIDRIS